MRSAETHAAYQKLKSSGGLTKECALCTAPSIHEFDFWRVIDNAYPYDTIAQVHHMLVPKRHVPDEELTEEEKQEYLRIKDTYLNEHYHFILEAVRSRKSIPGHAHLHLVVEYDE